MYKLQNYFPSLRGGNGEDFNENKKIYMHQLRGTEGK